MVGSSGQLRAGAVKRFALGERSIVLFRGRETGVVHALPGHCEHQGVDLAHGTVVGDCLRCPLHYWEYSDRCERIPGRTRLPRELAPAQYAVRERFGMIFLHVGAAPGDPIPAFSIPDEELFFRSGAAVEIDCPWYVPVANAFDMTHLETVHHRKLVSEPRITYPDARTFRVDYSTAVTGNGWSDRTMRFLSGHDPLRI